MLRQGMLQKLAQNEGARYGTQLLSPRLLLSNARGIADFPMKLLTGRVLVANIPKEINREALDALEERFAGIEKGARVLLRTNHSEKGARFSVDTANWLAEKGVALVGAEAGAISGGKEEQEVYHSLFSRGIWLVEGLDLTAVEEGYYKMICCPLHIENAVSAPARVELKRIKNIVLIKGFQQLASRL